MRRLYLMVGIILSATVPTHAQDATRRPMTTDDALNMATAGNVMMSPDGNWVFYSKSELDWDENKRKSTYYMIPSGGGEPRQYIGEAGGSNFQFSPQGTYLSFLRAVKDTNQLFLMHTSGGEAVQLSKHKTAIGSYVWGRDESMIYFVADEPRSADEQKQHKAGYDAVFIDEGPNGQRAAAWQNLWGIDITTKEETRLTNAEMRVSSFDVSPDQRRIVFVRRNENRRNQGNLSEIHMLDLTSRNTIQLTSNNAPERAVSWSPDGVHVAYEAPSDGEWELRLDRIWIMNAETRETRLVSAAFSGNISGLRWSADGSSVLFSGLQKTNTNLFRLQVSDGRLEQLTDSIGAFRVHDFSEDRRRIVYSFEDLDTPPDLYVSAIDNTDVVRLTTLNPWIENKIELADSRVVQWTSSDGTPIEGILILPDGDEASQRLPLLLHVHGGPAGVFTNTFRASNHVWAGLGYAQLQPNVRGSSGYTDELLRGNMRDIGGGDYWDLMTGVDYVVDQGIADPDRLGIRGWSYGGILGGWTITQTDRFKGASLGAMVSDWTSEYGPGFNFDVRNWYIGGTPWENAERYRAMSPLTHVANVTTPTLLMHGANDRTDTEQQSMMFFQALRDQGKVVRYIQFPREPHGFREPRHQRTRDIEEIKWIQQHVRGIEWTPWERPSASDSTVATVTMESP